MAEITLIEGLRQAMDEELGRDERVFIVGEDVGARGGVFRATQGLPITSKPCIGTQAPGYFLPSPNDFS